MALRWRFILSLFLFPALVRSQNINGLIRQAGKSLDQGNYAEAAALFERAGRLKPADQTLMFRAAEAYNQIRDYTNAANCYKLVRDNPEFPLAGLYYARMLKQQGLYEDARNEFKSAWEKYSGDHKEVAFTVVRNEIKGCDFGLSASPVADSSQGAPQLAHLQDPVSTSENEFAPLPFSDTLLYFTGIRDGKALLLRSSRAESRWKKPAEALGLPAGAAKGFLSGSFSPDGQRFYFARSESPPLAIHGQSLHAGKSALYVIKRTDSGEWSEPQRLRAYINMDGSSNLWPFVCSYGEEEWLFFSSDRAGGFGGMDLYVVKRPLSSDDFDFSFPLNLGGQINTGSDEVTPFYEVFSQTLWFSSMGHPSIGGFDIFSARGQGTEWSTPVNPGKPINSPADDYFYMEKKDGTGAFFSSNRPVTGQKSGQRDDDLFEVKFPSGQ